LSESVLEKFDFTSKGDFDSKKFEILESDVEKSLFDQKSSRFWNLVSKSQILTKKEKKVAQNELLGVRFRPLLGPFSTEYPYTGGSRNRFLRGPRGPGEVKSCQNGVPGGPISTSGGGP